MIIKLTALSSYHHLKRRSYISSSIFLTDILAAVSTLTRFFKSVEQSGNIESILLIDVKFSGLHNKHFAKKVHSHL